MNRVVVGISMTLSFLMIGGPSSATTAPAAPPAGGPWQYQLQVDPSRHFTSSGGIDTSCAPSVIDAHCTRARVFDIDLYSANGRTPNSAAVQAIHREGGYAICYIDAGTWESWRPDARSFPRGRLGRPNGWPGERWLDIRHPRVLLDIMARRLALCKKAGFNAVEFDNVDAYANSTGFPITGAEQITYDRALAGLAGRVGLAAGLKNDPGQVRALEPDFAFALAEQCIQFHFCAELAPFIAAHKPVYDVEYVGNPLTTCKAAPAGIDVIVKALSLEATPWRPCH